MARPGNRWLVCVGLGVAACSFDPHGQLPGDAAVIDGDDSIDAPDAAALDAPDAAPIDAIDAAPIDAPDAAIDAIAIDAPPPIGRMLVDDTAADFGQGGPSLDEARVEASGGVAPRAYYRGSLCAAGSDSLLFNDGHTATGAVLPANPTRNALARTVDLAVGDGAIPPGVGITAGTDWTLWWTGEVFLTAGAHTIALRADDHGFLEVQAPATTAFVKLLGVEVADGEQSITYTAATTGWYGLRLAVAQQGGPVELYARLDGAAIPRRLTRCRVDGFTGLAETGFDQSQFLDVAATVIEQSASAANIDWGNGAPADLGVTANDTFSVRWAGQAFIDVAGTYRLRVRSDDGYRLWVDGSRVIADLSDGLFDVTTGDLVLARGWHDVVFDTTESGGGARSLLSVASGPDLVGLAFPPARLRPAEGRFERFESATAPAIAEPGPATFGFAPATGAIVTGVDVGYVLSVDNIFPTVTTTLRDGTTATTLRNGGTGDTTDRFHPSAFDNLAFAPIFGIGLDVASGGGSLDESWLTVHHRDVAGTGPTPTAASFESSVRDLLGPGGTTVVAIDLLTFVTRAAAGGAATIALRTCDAPAACASTAYSTGFASGAAPGVVPRRYLQYRIDFVTDGDHEPAVERVQIDYQTQ